MNPYLIEERRIRGMPISVQPLIFGIMQDISVWSRLDDRQRADVLSNVLHVANLLKGELQRAFSPAGLLHAIMALREWHSFVNSDPVSNGLGIIKNDSAGAPVDYYWELVRLFAYANYYKDLLAGYQKAEEVFVFELGSIANSKTDIEDSLRTLAAYEVAVHNPLAEESATIFAFDAAYVACDLIGRWLRAGELASAHYLLWKNKPPESESEFALEKFSEALLHESSLAGLIEREMNKGRFRKVWILWWRALLALPFLPLRRELLRELESVNRI